MKCEIFATFAVCLAVAGVPGIHAVSVMHPSAIAHAGYSPDYEDDVHAFLNVEDDSLYGGWFPRFQSSDNILRICDDASSSAKRRLRRFRKFNGKDGRKGYFRSTKLGGDYVLAESKQVAVNCTCEEVLRAYLNGDLQTKWNDDKVIDCSITERTPDGEEEAYYQQDLILHSQKVIRSQTGVMRYSQRISIDKIGDNNYCVSVSLDPNNATPRKPFDKLNVYVGLQQRQNDVHIYAAGVMQVNRKVVPNLIVFDASGIAGSMAGKGTLWLAGHFDKIKGAHL